MLAPLTQQLHAAWHPLTSLATLVDEWRGLAARSLQPNIFYEPDFALPAASVFGADAGTVLVRNADGLLTGLFPARVDHHRYGVAPAVLTGWTHPYAPLGIPLVDRDHADNTLNAWLDHLMHKQGPRFLLMPFLPDDGPFAAALAQVLESRGLSCAAFGRHHRALLEPGGHRAGYIEHAVSHKMRKELARKRRRLADLGDLTHESASDAISVQRILDAFLALEDKGWKGRAGTAARQHQVVRQFMQNAILNLAKRGQARADRLSVGGRTVAATIVLRSGSSAWGWKIAYDESFARQSPGVQLVLDVTQTLLDDSGIARTDSCATPDHPMIDHIWRERLAVSDRLIALRPGDSAGFRIACSLETLRRSAFGAAKFVRDSVVRR